MFSSNTITKHFLFFLFQDNSCTYNFQLCDYDDCVWQTHTIACYARRKNFDITASARAYTAIIDLALFQRLAINVIALRTPPSMPDKEVKFNEEEMLNNKQNKTRRERGLHINNTTTINALSIKFNINTEHIHLVIIRFFMYSNGELTFFITYSIVIYWIPALTGGFARE